MKKTLYVIIAILLSASSVWAQDTKGTDFWITFGRNANRTYDQVDLQIRVVGGDEAGYFYVYYSALGYTEGFSIGADEVKTVNLTPTQKQAVYNDYTTTMITNRSIHITSTVSVVVYVLNQAQTCTDATNVLPTASLGTEYYLLSYLPYTSTYRDAYTVVANQNNTEVYANNTLVTTLNAGGVYYAVASNGSTNLTGTHITASAPVSVFADCWAIGVPVGVGGDKAFQQMAPVNTWGKTFFIPLATQPVMMQRVRAIACMTNTTLTVTNGTLTTDGGGKNSLTLDVGEWLELEITSGCYIEANNPIAVCSYLNGYTWSTRSDGAQTWIPALDQGLLSAFVAPFIPAGGTNLDQHFALIVTPTDTKDLTTVSIGGGAPTGLSGGGWIAGPGNMSYYEMPLTNTTSSYTFENAAKIIVLGYGTGESEAYYYLAGSAMRDLKAAFYANDIHYQDLENNPLCAGEIEFRADIENMDVGIDSLKWFIDGVEYLPAQNQETWSKTFAAGEYEIEMLVYFENDETISKIGTLKIISCGTSAEFYANDVHHSALPDTTFCSKLVNFHAEIEGLHSDAGSLKWFIDGVEETAALDQLEWSKEFETGVYEIKMEVVYADNATETIISTLKVEVFWIKMKNVTH
ncbi:MAG: IgGFc-binding protein [Bacteroidales bacterium]|nr:IgGFc-binding protein [Bacteroidales bacterium]